jgi:hypothetical protein
MLPGSCPRAFRARILRAASTDPFLRQIHLPMLLNLLTPS